MSFFALRYVRYKRNKFARPARDLEPSLFHLATIAKPIPEYSVILYSRRYQSEAYFYDASLVWCGDVHPL